MEQMSENNSCAPKRRAHGELGSGEGRSSHAEMQGSGPATTMPAAVKPRLLPRQSRLEERPLSLGRNHVQGPDRSGGGPVEGGAGADKGEPGGPAPSGKASGAPGRTQLHSRQGGQQRTGSLDAGPGVTSLGHPAKRASRGGPLGPADANSECSSRRERAYPAVAICRLHLQARPSPPARPRASRPTTGSRQLCWSP